MKTRDICALLLAAPLAGCAMRSDVNRLELQLAQARVERSRADSVNAVNMAAVARMVQSLYDTLASQADALTRMRGDTRVELYNIEQQLVAIQELTGQSQQRLTELRGSMDERFQALASAAPAQASPAAPGDTSHPAPRPGDTTRAATPAPASAPAAGAAASNEPSADQLMELSLAQLRRGSPGTARMGLAEFLRRYPTNPRAVDAVFFTGESWAADNNKDSAAASYRQVVNRFPTAPRAASAMYKLGLLAAQAGQRDTARTWFNRVVTAFPNSEEAALARDQLRQPAPTPAAPTRQPAATPATPARPRPRP